MWTFDICTTENTLKILMCCILDIQPNDFPKFLAATLHYTNCFVNYQTNNAEYFSNVYGNKYGHSVIYRGFCQCNQKNNNLLNIVI